MKLPDVFGKYYDQQQQEYVVFLLKSYGLYEDLQSTSGRFYQVNFNAAKPESLSIFSDLLSGYLSIINCVLNRDCEHQMKDSDFSVLLNAMSVLFTDAMTFSQTTFEEFSQILKKEIHSGLSLANPETWICSMFLSQVMMKMPTAVQLSSMAETKEKCRPTIYFKFLKKKNDAKNKINLGRLVAGITETFPGVTTTEAIFGIFDRKETYRKITVPLEQLPALLVFFGLLHQCKRIKLSPTRGLFRRLQELIKVPPHEKLPERKVFRTLKREALDDPDLNLTIRKQIEKLFDIFCPGKKNKKIFMDCFHRKSKPA